MSICELLSPAGGPEALHAAVSAGADSVYLGGAAFNARQSAVNFDNEALKNAVDYCHLRGVKVYVTVNTLTNDREMEKMAEYLRFLSEIGTDAVIVQDLGVARLTREIVPELPLNASTQMTVYDKEGALLLQELGFKRVVLARELSETEIAKIRDSVDIEIEVFVHGAICVCYSGQCLMSSFIGGRSGNRGACAQPCRLKYSIDGKNGYLLSPKDMGLIKHLDRLKKIGVNSLKIEGRMKGAEYVGTVVSIYRKYLDSGKNVTSEDYGALERVFFRGGLTDGYFTGKRSGMMCHTKPDNPYLKQKKFEIQNFEKKRTADFTARITLGEPVSVTAKSGGCTVTYKGTVPAETAVTKPLENDRVTAQLSKLGQTVFTPGCITAEIEQGVTIPISELNAARRGAVMLLEQEITKSYRRENRYIKPSAPKKRSAQSFELSVYASTREQAQQFYDVKRLYVPIDIYDGHGIAVLPRFNGGNVREIVSEKGCKKVLVRTLGQINALKNTGIEIYADYTLNAFNSYAADMLESLGVDAITLSPELTLAQIRSLKSPVPLESIIYGYIPLMITKNCLIKPAVGCKKKGGAVLSDRTGTKFKIACADGCRNEIFNSLPVVMSDKMSAIRQSGLSFGRLMFTDEKPSLCREIYENYKNGTRFCDSFTRGKFYKGV